MINFKINSRQQGGHGGVHAGPSRYGPQTFGSNQPVLQVQPELHIGSAGYLVTFPPLPTVQLPGNHIGNTGAAVNGGNGNPAGNVSSIPHVPPFDSPAPTDESLQSGQI